MEEKMGVDPVLEPFLDDIRACPADDAPRMALADFLEDRGDPLGRFIALSLDHAAYARGEINPDVEAEKRVALLGAKMREQSRRACELFWPGVSKENGGLADFSMLPPWDELVVRTGIGTARKAVIMERGLPARVYCQMHDWMRLGARVVAAPVTFVGLTNREPAMEDPVLTDRVGQTRYRGSGTVPRDATFVWHDSGRGVSWPLDVGIMGPSDLYHELAMSVCYTVINEDTHGVQWVNPVSNGRFATRVEAVLGLSGGCLRWARFEASRLEDARRALGGHAGRPERG